MSIPRLYLPHSIETGDVCIATAEQARYIKTVLRMRAGEPLLVFNGTGWEYEAVIRQTAEGLALEINGRRPITADRIEITLCQAIPKADKMEAIIRHATELGAGRIIPFHAERSIPRWPAEKVPAEAGALAEDRRRGVPSVRPGRHSGDRGDCVVHRDAPLRPSGMAQSHLLGGGVGQGDPRGPQGSEVRRNKRISSRRRTGGGIRQKGNRPGFARWSSVRESGKTGTTGGYGGGGRHRHPPIREGCARRSREGRSV